MIKVGFFTDYISALEKGDFIFMPEHVRFYLEYLGMDTARLDTEAVKVKKFGRKGSFDIQKYCADFFSDRLQETIIANEKHLFLKRHLEELYADIETWVKKEYFELTGEKVEGDLFQIDRFETSDNENIPF